MQFFSTSFGSARRGQRFRQLGDNYFVSFILAFGEIFWGRRRTKKPCRRERRIHTRARMPHQMDQILISLFTTASIVDRMS